jgi:hypothetical protein
MRAQIDRDDADRCVHLLSRVRSLRHDAETEAGPLLRVLFLRLGSLSTDANGLIVLRDSRCAHLTLEASAE